jgi:hypothetical protein
MKGKHVRKNFTKNYIVLVPAVLLLSLTITMNAQNEIPRDGLIVYYPFNNDFNDKSGNNFNGKVNEAVLTGAKNKACFFDGINDYIEVSDIEEHLKCLEVLSARDVPVFYPDGGIAIGQRFHYVRD